MRLLPLLPMSLVLAGCASTPAPTSRTQITMPEVLGTPIAILAPELPAGAIADGERARFDIAFAIDLRGSVIESRVESSTRPDLADAMQAQHRQWVYAVATRHAPCAMRRFRGVQSLEVERRGGKLVANAEPARVIEVLATRKAALADGQQAPTPINYRQVMGGIAYPRDALLRGLQASFAVVAVFDQTGAVKEAYPVNAAHDSHGFSRSALDAVRRLKMEPPPSRDLTTCVPVDFRIR